MNALTHHFCPHCRSAKALRRAGYAWTDKGKVQRYKCASCHRHTVKPRSRPR